MRKKFKCNIKGITLVALVVTIIVLLILAGVSIVMITGNNGILTQAQKAKIATELSNYKEQLELYKNGKQTENKDFLESSLTVGKENLTYNTQPQGEKGNIKTVISNIKDEYIDKIEIIKGKLLINTQDKEEIEIAKNLGITINPYDIINGELLSSNGNLLLMDENGTVTIPDSVTKIGEGAFANLEGLKTIIIPGTVKEIGKNAFAYNATLENIIMQEGVETIDDYAFMECQALKSVQMPETMKTMGRTVFYHCCNLTEIEIPSQINIISMQSFTSCNNLKKVKFRGKNVTEIGNEAFLGTAISSFEITSRLSKLDSTALGQCHNLDNIVIANDNKNFVYQSGILLSADMETILFVSEKYYINESVFSIPEGVVNFETYISPLSNIKKLNIPKSLQKLNVRFLPTSITNVEVAAGNSNFYVLENCIYSSDNQRLIYCFSKEKDITLKNKVKIINSYSFMGAINAEKITLADSVETIQEVWLSNVQNLKEINVGKSLKNIDGNFALNSNWKFTLNIDKENPNYIVEKNIIYSKDKETLVGMLYKIDGEFTIDSNVKTLGPRALRDQQNMTKVNLNDRLENISMETFYGCTNLKEIEIPSSVKYINDTTFIFSINLDKIIINNSENSIEGAPWGASKGMKVVNWN